MRVEALALNARVSAKASTREELPVAEAFSTLQEAADAARGGDSVAVMPGTYVGFALGDKPDAGDGRYIHFKALGKPGEVVIDRPSVRDRRG